MAASGTPRRSRPAISASRVSGPNSLWLTGECPGRRDRFNRGPNSIEIGGRSGAAQSRSPTRRADRPSRRGHPAMATDATPPPDRGIDRGTPRGRSRRAAPGWPRRPAELAHCVRARGYRNARIVAGVVRLPVNFDGPRARSALGAPATPSCNAPRVARRNSPGRGRREPPRGDLTRAWVPPGRETGGDERGRTQLRISMLRHARVVRIEARGKTQVARTWEFRSSAEKRSPLPIARAAQPRVSVALRC